MANRYRWDGDDTDDLDKEALEAALRDGAPSWETKPASGSRNDEGPRNSTMPVSRSWQPPEASTRQATSAYAPRLEEQNGQWTLLEHGNRRPLQQNEVADMQRYVSDFWQKFPTGFQPGNERSVADAYRQFLGRDPDAEGLAAHRRNPQGFQGIIDTIANSPEAAAFRERQARAQTQTGTGNTSSTNTNTNNGWTPPTPQIFQGFRPRHAMEGFDFNREQNTGKSAKDAFAYLANQAPPPPLNDKAALGAWFTQYIQPGMNALGHTVTEVNGDTFKFKNWQGEFTVDYGRGAGAPGGALAWQVQDDAQLAPNATYTPQPTGGGVTTQTTTPPAGPRLVDPLAPITDTPNIEELMAEIDALVNGRPLPSDARALAALLRGEP